MACSLRRIFVIGLVILVCLDASSAQQVRRRRPHYPRFEIIWPLHWVSAAYVWGFLKMSAIFGGLMLLFAYRHLSVWGSGSTFFNQYSPVYHYRSFNSDPLSEVTSENINDHILYWSDQIGKVIETFGDNI